MQTEIAIDRNEHDAATRTLLHLDLYLRGYAYGLARGALMNDGSPNVTEKACARYRELCASHLGHMLVAAGYPAEPYVAAWKVVARG